MDDEIEPERASAGPNDGGVRQRSPLPQEVHDGPRSNERSLRRRSVVVNTASTMQKLSTFRGAGSGLGEPGTRASSPTARQRRGSFLSRPPSIAPSLGRERVAAEGCSQAVARRARAFQDGPGGVNYFDVLVANMNRITCLPSGFLEAKTRSWETARRETARGNIMWMLCSSRPLCVALNSPRFRCMLLICCAATLATVCMELYHMSLMGIPLYAHYRFTALEVRRGGSIDIPVVADIGLVQRELHVLSSPFLSAKSSADWCWAPVMRRAVSSVSGSSMLLTLSDADVGSGEIFVGWYFRTAWNGSVDDDPTRFVLEGSNDRASWEQIGSSSSESLAGIQIFHDERFETPHDRGWPVVFDSRPAWYDYFEPLGRCILALGLLPVVVLACCDRAVDAMRVFVLCCYCMSLNSFVAAVGAAATADGGGVTVVFFAVKCGLHFGTGFLLDCYERFFDVVLFMGALVYMLFLVYVHVHVHVAIGSGWPGVFSLRAPMLLESMIICLASLCIVLWRQMMVSRFRTPILSDKQRYSAAWEVIKGSENNQRELASLENLVSDIAQVTSGRLARQFNRASTLEEGEKGCASSEEEPDEPRMMMPSPLPTAAEGPSRRRSVQHSDRSLRRPSRTPGSIDDGLPTPQKSPSNSPMRSPAKSTPTRSPQLKKSPAARRLSSQGLISGGNMPSLTATPAELGTDFSRTSSNREALSSFTTTLIKVDADLYEQQRTKKGSFTAALPQIVRSPKSRMSKDMDEIVPLSESANDSFSMDIVLGTDRRRKKIPNTISDRDRTRDTPRTSLDVSTNAAGGAYSSGRGDPSDFGLCPPQQFWVNQILRGDSTKTNASDVGVDVSELGMVFNQVTAPAAAMSTRAHNKLLKGWRSTRFFNASAGSGIEQMVGERMVYTIDISSPVTSLDQLHAQACILNPLLLSRTLTYAERYNGKLPALGSEGERRSFVTYHSCMGLRGLQVGTVKEVGRCVEKLQRSYQGDVSKLLDCCRQTIYFDSPADIVDCLTAVWLDNGVEIVRIKNTMTTVDDHNEALFSGFRYIAVNFRFRDDVTAELGVESHVVELLLILTQIAELRTYEAHERYLDFHDSRYASSLPPFPFMVTLKNALKSITALAFGNGKDGRNALPSSSYLVSSRHSEDTASSNRSRRRPPSTQVVASDTHENTLSLQASSQGGVHAPSLELSSTKDTQPKCDQAPEHPALFDQGTMAWRSSDKSGQEQALYTFGRPPSPLRLSDSDVRAGASEEGSLRETSSPPLCRENSLDFMEMPSLEQETVTQEELRANDFITKGLRTGRMPQSIPRTPGSSRSPARLSRCDSESSRSVEPDPDTHGFPRRNRSPCSPTSRIQGLKHFQNSTGKFGGCEGGSPQTSPKLRLDVAAGAPDHPSPTLSRTRGWMGNMLPSIPASPEPIKIHKHSSPELMTPLGLPEDAPHEPSRKPLDPPTSARTGTSSALVPNSPSKPSALRAHARDPPNSPPFLRPFSGVPNSPILAFGHDAPDSPPALRPFPQSEDTHYHRQPAERNAGASMARSGWTSGRTCSAQQEHEAIGISSPPAAKALQAGGKPSPIMWAEGGWTGMELRSASWRDRPGPLACTSLATSSRTVGSSFRDSASRQTIRSHSPLRKEPGSVLSNTTPVPYGGVAANASATHGLMRRSSLPNMHTDDQSSMAVIGGDRMGARLRIQIENSLSRQGAWPSDNMPARTASSHIFFSASEAGTSCSGSYAPTRLHTPSPTNKATKPDDCHGNVSPSISYFGDTSWQSPDDGSAFGNDSLMTSWLKSLSLGTAGGMRNAHLGRPIQNMHEGGSEDRSSPSGSSRRGIRTSPDHSSSPLPVDERASRAFNPFNTWPKDMRSEWDGSMSPTRTGHSSPLTPRTSFTFKSPLPLVKSELSPVELKGLGLPVLSIPPVENATQYFTPRRFSPPKLFGTWGPRDEGELRRCASVGNAGSDSPMTERGEPFQRSRSVDEGMGSRSLDIASQLSAMQRDGTVQRSSFVSVSSDETCRQVKHYSDATEPVCANLLTPPPPRPSDVHCITSTGFKMTGDMVEILEMYCRIAALGLSSLLDRNCKHAYKLGLENASTKSVFFTSRPVTAGSMKGWIQVGAITLAALYLWCTSNGVQRNLENGIRPVPKFLNYKMLSLTKRDGGNATEPGVQEFGLLELDGRSPLGDLGLAASHLPTPQRHTEGPAMYLSYPNSVLMRGWYIITRDSGDASSDPVFFEVYGSNSSLPQPKELRAHQSEDVSSMNYAPIEGLGDGGFGDMSRKQTRQPLDYRHQPIQPPSQALVRQAEPDSMVWVKIGNPVWVTAPQHDANTHFTDMPSWSIPQTRGTVLVFDPTQPWQYAVSEIVCRMCIACGLLGFSMLGWMKAASVARAVLGISFLVTACFKITCVGSHIFAGNWLPAYGFFADVPAMCAICWGIWYEKHFVKMLGVAGVLDLFLFTAQVLFLCPRKCIESVTALEFLRVTGPILMVLFGVIHFLRLSALRDSRRLVKADKERYDALWRELVELDKDVGAIEKVELVLRMTGLDDGDVKNCHQYNRLRSDRFRLLDDSICSRRSSMNFLRDVLGDVSTIPKTLDVKSPIMSVDQLYAQALVANLVLADKVRSWAAASNGYFQLKQKRAEKEAGLVPVFVPWRSVQDDPAMVAKVKWTPLKRYKRMIEKLLRSYDADTSRICDISRHAILFENLEDLSVCIELMTADDEIRIERFKNRMAPSYKSEESAGYRDVALNVRVHDHPATIALGGETHVCEVQLILLKFAELKDREGHKRYVAFRNTRAT